MGLNRSAETWGQPAEIAAEVARRYGLAEPMAMAPCMPALCRAVASEGGFAPPDYLSPWYWPLIRLLLGKPHEWRILDFYCGIPLAFHFLSRKGFAALFGAEDARATPGIVKAAREFCARTGTKAVIEDVAGLHADAYAYAFGRERFDVAVCLRGAPDFALVNALLRQGGLFVAKTAFAQETQGFGWGFETLATFPVSGVSGERGGGAVGVFRKRRPLSGY